VSNVNVIPNVRPGSGPGTRRQAGGSICPTCRAAPKHAEHVCITRGGDLTDVMPDDNNVPAWRRLFDELSAHPAQPWAGGAALRPVDRSWCMCACQPSATTEAGHGN
jgi:hypothetical protein